MMTFRRKDRSSQLSLSSITNGSLALYFEPKMLLFQVSDTTRITISILYLSHFLLLLFLVKSMYKLQCALH